MNEIGMTPNLIGSGIENYLELNEKPQDDARLKSVAKDFESVFLSMIMKEMRNTLEDGGFFSGDSSDTYGGMLDLYLGQSLAESGPLGIGELFLESYEKNKPGVDQTEPTETDALNEPA